MPLFPYFCLVVVSPSSSTVKPPGCVAARTCGQQATAAECFGKTDAMSGWATSTRCPHRQRSAFGLAWHNESRSTRVEKYSPARAAECTIGRTRAAASLGSSAAPRRRSAACPAALGRSLSRPSQSFSETSWRRSWRSRRTPLYHQLVEHTAFGRRIGTPGVLATFRWRIGEVPVDFCAKGDRSTAACR